MFGPHAVVIQATLTLMYRTHYKALYKCPVYHHHLYSSKTHNTKAAIENCGQDKSGNSTYNCPKNRHKSIKTIKHKNNQHKMTMKNYVAGNEKNQHCSCCV